MQNSRVAQVKSLQVCSVRGMELNEFFMSVDHSLIVSLLTGILHRCYHQLETVRIGSPAICNVLQRHEVRACQYRIHRVLRVAARDVDLQGINRVYGKGNLVVIAKVLGSRYCC